MVNDMNVFLNLITYFFRFEKNGGASYATLHLCHRLLPYVTDRIFSYRQPIEAHVYISDGHVHFIEFDSSTTAREVSSHISSLAAGALYYLNI